ncbi:MAG: multidrug efflux MFS transporter [Chloroflexi bacterium]|nr:multidrug efflux MFS transporter [Chloroflexota bacterium]
MATNWKRTLYIMVFAQAMSTLGFSTIFPFLPLYVEDLGSSTGMGVELLSGLVFSGQAITMMIAAPIWGALADRHGRKLMVERATFGGAVIIALMAFVRSGEELVILRAIQGMLTGIASAGNALVAASVPRERTGYAMGLMQVGMWSGISIGPLVGGVAADAFGFRASFLVTGVLLLAAGILVWRGVDEHFEPRVITGEKRGSILADWRYVLSMPGVLPTYSTRFMAWLGRTMPTPFMPLFLQSLLPEGAQVATLTGVIVAVSSVAGTISAVYMGRLGDRIGHKRVLLASASAGALFYFPQTFVTETWQLLVLQALTGFAAGGIMPVISALLARYTLPGEEGAVYGLENSIVSASRAIAPMIGSPLVLWFGLRSVFTATGVLFAIATLFALHWLPDLESAHTRAAREERQAAAAGK